MKKNKHTYSEGVVEKSIIINLTSPESYQKKAEEIANEIGAYPNKSTVYYYHTKYSDELFEYLEQLQFQKIEDMNITPSGIYCYDEQYVFINKNLYLRLTIIDYKNKLIIADELISKEAFDDQTLENFFKEHLEKLPLKIIITDGRKGYKTIIEAVGAIQHRCFSHIMQNLMTPLQKHKNKIERRIKTLNQKIEDKTEKIKEIQNNKKKYIGPIPQSDKKTRRQHNQIKKLEQDIKKHHKEIKEKTKELKEINYNQERIQKIWDSKTIKQAQRRYNTLYNQKNYLNPIIAKFLDNIKPDLDVNPKSLNGYRNTSNKQHNRKLLQNNTTTKSKKNIQNTQRIKTKNKRTTNKMDPQNSTKTKHTNQHEHSIQLSKTNPTFNSHNKY